MLPTVTPGRPTLTPTSPPTATIAPPTATPLPGGACVVEWSPLNQWGNVFQAEIKITNHTSTAVSSWTLKFDFPGNQTITSMWGGLYDQSSSFVTVTNESWNGNIGAGGSTSVSFQASFSGSNNAPTSFTLNGMVCD